MSTTKTAPATQDDTGLKALVWLLAVISTLGVAASLSTALRTTMDDGPALAVAIGITVALIGAAAVVARTRGSRAEGATEPASRAGLDTRERVLVRAFAAAGVAGLLLTVAGSIAVLTLGADGNLILPVIASLVTATWASTPLVLRHRL